MPIKYHNDDRVHELIVPIDFIFTHTSCHARVLTISNAGGSSEFSEFYAFCVISKCMGFKLLLTEMEVIYFPYGSSMTDFIVHLNDLIVAVSVSRIFSWNNTFITDEMIITLLIKKIRCIKNANRNTMTRWDTQILFIWIPDTTTSRRVKQIWKSLKENNIILIICISSDMRIYSN